MIKKRLFRVVDSSFYFEIGKIQSNLSKRWEKYCGIDFEMEGSITDWNRFYDVRKKAQRKGKLNKKNYTEFYLSLIYTFLKNTPRSKKHFSILKEKEKCILKTFKDCIKQEYELKLKDLKPYQKIIEESFPRDMEKLKKGELKFLRY